MTAIPQERRIVTAVPGPKSQELQARRSAAVAGGVGSVMPVFAARAGGGVVEDVDGNRLIDFGSGIAVTSVGSSAEAVVRRASAQLADFTHTCFMVTPYEGYVEVCERLAELTPGDHAKKSALFNSGAEAVENAVKIARSYTGRQAIVVFDHGYHGRTNLTMALTSKNMPYKNGFGPFAPEIYRVPVAYGYRWPTGPENCGPEASAQVIDQISKQIGAENVAAIIIEPVLGEGGFIEPAKGFLPALARFAKDHGIVFVADEIQSGFCRTGQWFACEDEGVVPDLITTAKGIAGGLPLAAVTGRAEIMDAAHAGGLGGTYGGNPVACAAALGAIETMKELDLVSKARRIEEIMKSRLAGMREKYDIVGDVRGRGAMLAIELVKDRDTKEPAPEATAALARACHAEGLLVLTCGTYGNVLRFLPPLVIGEDLLNEGLDILEQAFAAL
ncbi:4-aminobutyrate--2-oxoglutarate transaminase [Streptomyces sp. NPDC006923]|uniref:4-aminobutyrate--2-oxoglutarate transaminase n=1 Tax=Streptomyces sp. NPDC006923 TaxID=3155355 RepID=UPI0033C60212